MIVEKAHIRIGYFENFKGEDSILISADINGLRELEDIFLRLSQGLPDFDFLKLKHLDRSFYINLKALNDKENYGLRKISITDFEWRLTSEKWNQCREKLTLMYRNNDRGHHYLDSDAKNNEDIQVVFSFNEYSNSFWEEHKL